MTRPRHSARRRRSSTRSASGPDPAPSDEEPRPRTPGGGSGHPRWGPCEAGTAEKVSLRVNPKTHRDRPDGSHARCFNSSTRSIVIAHQAEEYVFESACGAHAPDSHSGHHQRLVAWPWLIQRTTRADVSSGSLMGTCA